MVPKIMQFLFSETSIEEIIGLSLSLEWYSELIVFFLFTQYWLFEMIIVEFG